MLLNKKFISENLLKTTGNLKSIIGINLRLSKYNTPNISTLLGSFGISLGVFEKQFKTYILGLPEFFKLNIFIVFLQDRSLLFFSNFLSLSFFFRICAKKKRIKKKGSGGFFFLDKYFLGLKKFLLVHFFVKKSFNNSCLRESFGTLQSMDIFLEN